MGGRQEVCNSFVLASTSLLILFFHAFNDQRKYEKLERCEQPSGDEDKFSVS